MDELGCLNEIQNPSFLFQNSFPILEGDEIYKLQPKNMTSKYLFASYKLHSYKLSYVIVLKFLYVRAKCVFSFVYSNYCFVNVSSWMSSAFLESCRVQLYYVMLCIRNRVLQRKLN